MKIKLLLQQDVWKDKKGKYLYTWTLYNIIHFHKCRFCGYLYEKILKNTTRQTITINFSPTSFTPEYIFSLVVHSKFIKKDKLKKLK